MRGVVSVAAALALPLTVNNGVPYENRSLLIFITFFVVLVTLVLQGSTLPMIIEWLRLPPYSELIEEYETRQKVLNASVAYIEENLAGIEDEALSRLKLKYEMKYKKLNKTDLPSNYFEELGEEDEEAEAVTDLFNRFTYLQLELIREERKTLRLMRKKGIVSDEIVRKIVYELDLEEASLRVDLD
jgi:CPA1 family monovalent cation:H+ antiporter